MNALARIGPVAAFVLLTGCAPIQQWLEPRVCDCQAEKAQARAACNADSVEAAGTVADYQIAYAYQQAGLDKDEAARELEEMAREDDSETLYRAPEELAEEPINPLVDDAAVELTDEKARDDFQQRHGFDPPPEGEIFRGQFTSGTNSTLAVHRPGQTLELYDSGRRVASVDLRDYDEELAPDEVMGFPTGTIELVQDGTQQLKLVHGRTDDDGRVTYDLTIYKFIGSRIGTIFSRPVAVRDEDGSIRQLARPRYLHGLDHRIIQWTPLNDEGEPGDDAKHYEWNRWEGVYRIPGPPPTAPEVSM